MSTSFEAPISTFQPGDVIELGEISKLAEFEELVATDLQPNMTKIQRDVWAGRVALKELIRPPKFNGSLVNVRLEVMDEPYSRLLVARERGMQFHLKGRPPQNNPVNVGTWRGFKFITDARSSVPGFKAQVQTELWYVLLPYIPRITKGTLKSGEERSYLTRCRMTNSNSGASIRRTVAKPVLEKHKFIELNENSRKIGFSVLQKAMMHPLIQPMHQ